MTVYTSDVDIIYSNLRNHTITNDSVRILSSDRPQSLSLLKDFPYIEEIHCNIICLPDEVNNLDDLICQCHRLTLASFIIYIPSSDDDESGSPPRKRLRIKRTTPYNNVMKQSIPNMINKLGKRMRYLNLTITVVDSDSVKISFLSLNKGIFCVVSNEGENDKTHQIFHSFAATGSLRTLITKGDSNYDLSKISSIPELVIVPRIFDEDNPINEAYLEDLVYRSETVTLLYDPQTINNISLYSEIIKYGSKNNLKRIKGIVPLSDVEEHIIINSNLEEIHTIVKNSNDIDDMRDIIDTYSHRDITYYIYYHRVDDTDYWSCLKNSTIPVDIVFKDIVRSFIS